MEHLNVNSLHLKELNTERIRWILKNNVSVTKLRLAEESGLSIATCGNLLAGMLDSGEAVAQEFAESTGGRPAQTFAYNFRYVMMALLHLGVDAGRRTLSVTIADAAGKTVESMAHEVKSITPEVLYASLEEVLRKYPAVAAVSISYPGVVNDGVTDHGVGDLPELYGCDLKSELEKRFPVKTAVENDMNLAALGYFSANKCPHSCGLSYVAFFDLPGCGSIVNGKLIRGSRGFAGEVTWLPFGRTWQELVEAMKSRSEAVNQVAGTILALTAVLNPDIVVLCGKIFDDSSIHDEIIAACGKPLIGNFLPRIVFTGDWMNDITAGLREAGLELLRCPVKLVHC